MSRPEEVMVMENDDGEIVRVETQDTDASALYKLMKETLVLLSTVDYEITEAIFMSSLDDEVGVSLGSERQMQKSSDEPFRSTLQPLVWSIGSVSGVMNEEQERRLLVATIMDLLRLIQMKSTKDDKVIIAGCLMYVIQQYPRFLKLHYALLRTVIRKNFDFMHETHPGVQDMACDTFLKLARNCGSQLIIPHQTEKGGFPPFFEETLPSVGSYTELLSTQQVEVFYSAMATILKFQRSAETRNQWIGALLLPFDREMQRVIREGVQNESQFRTPANLLAIRRALRIHRVVCEVLLLDFATEVGLDGRA